MEIKEFLEQQKTLSKDVNSWCGVYHLKDYIGEEFDTLRQAWIDARTAYNSALELIGQASKSLSNTIDEKNKKLRNDCRYIYSLNIEVDKKGNTVFKVVGEPEYIIKGDEKSYEVHNYQPFYIVNDVIIIKQESGYRWNDMESGDTIGLDTKVKLLSGIIPDCILARTQRKPVPEEKIIMVSMNMVEML